MIKLFTLLLSLVVLPTPVYAELVEQQKSFFDVKVDALLKGDIHYSLNIGSAQELLDKAPDLQDLDSVGLLKDTDSKIIFSKTAYIVKKPVSFFDHKQVMDPAYLSHTMVGKKVERKNDNTFKVKDSGLMPSSYTMKLYYDSDDVSTLQQKRANQIVTNSKRLDVIAQSAHSSLYKEMDKFSKYYSNAFSITHHIPLTDSKTLVITYKVTAVKKFFAIEKILRPQFLNEIKDTKSKIDSFKLD